MARHNPGLPALLAAAVMRAEEAHATLQLAPVTAETVASLAVDVVNANTLELATPSEKATRQLAIEVDAERVRVKFSAKRQTLTIHLPPAAPKRSTQEQPRAEPRDIPLDNASAVAAPQEQPRAEQRDIPLDNSSDALEAATSSLLSPDAPPHIKALLDDAARRGLDRAKVARDLARRALSHAQGEVEPPPAAPPPASPPPPAKPPAEEEPEPAHHVHACLLPPRVTSLQELKSSSSKKGKKASSPLAAVAQLAHSQLSATSTAVIDGFLSAEQLKNIRREIAQLEPQYETGEIWVGKDAGAGAQISVASVRGDRVLWVDKESLAKGPFHALREAVRSIDKLVVSELSRRTPKLKHVNERSDPMLSIYPGRGSRFQKHVDNTAEDGRVLTVLCYLNERWEADMGGQLRVWEADGAAKDVCPSGGRLAMFFADEVPHEVLPSHARREAFTLWYYDANERKRAVDRDGGAMKHHPELLDRRRGGEAQARAFLKFVLTENLGVAQVAEAAGRLSAEACEAVGAVLLGGGGDRTGEGLAEAMRNLTDDGLRELRARLVQMGL